MNNAERIAWIVCTFIVAFISMFIGYERGVRHSYGCVLRIEGLQRHDLR